MNLSQRQQSVCLHVKESSNLLEDLCRMVAQYVFAGSFKMALRKELNLPLASIVHHKMDDSFVKATGLPESICCLVTDYLLSFPELPRVFIPEFNPNEKHTKQILDQIVAKFIGTGVQIFWIGSTMTEKQWSCDAGTVCCEGRPLIHLGGEARWLGCNPSRKQTYWLTSTAVRTVNDKGEEPMGPLRIPDSIHSALCTSSIVTPADTFVVWFKTLDNLCLLWYCNLLGTNYSSNETNYSSNERTCGLVRDRYLIKGFPKLRLLSGEEEDEIWLFDTGGTTTVPVLSAKTMKLLRRETINSISPSRLVQVGYTLYGLRNQETSLGISVFT
jgi:hypothetical protein